MRVYVKHSDAGHGWLAVKIAHVIGLGIAESISAYSYVRGRTVYLEEDRDMGVFYSAARQQGYEFLVREGKWVERSPIRSYARWDAGLYLPKPVPMKTVVNLMSGQPVDIPVDTPLCCDPSSETYWSM
jgi:hypothetical protein